MRSRSAASALQILFALPDENLGQFPILSPALVEPQGHRLTEQGTQRLAPVRFELPHGSNSCSGKHPGQAHQFRVPGAGIASGSERRIALLQGAGVVHPHPNEAWFHVEHSPVKPAPAVSRALLDHPVNPRIEHLDRKGLGQLGQ